MCLSVCTLTLGEPFKVILYRLEALLLEFLDVSKRKVTLDLMQINVWHPRTQTCVPEGRICYLCGVYPTYSVRVLVVTRNPPA